MSYDPFSYEAMRQQLEEFAETVPVLLSNNPLTAKYATGLNNLLDQVDAPFTVAVTGQMRVGKSTLLNALIGEDLAITGVNETTATINWFKHGTAELIDKFNVVWKGKPPELFPISEIDEWIGDSKKAADTRYLEFFSGSELLKSANFIDTPGTRSTIESHEETINEFLATRCENETMRQGGKADAIVYVFPTVARETDKDRLNAYGSDSRIPGSSPFNSIGVLHKWDALDVEDVFAEATRKAQIVAGEMKDLVADVIPVSAPLHIAAERYDDKFWHVIVDLASLDDDLDFKELLISSERDFKSEQIPECALSAKDRTQFRSDFPLPWSSLRLILRHIRKLEIKTADMARKEILERSGISYLRKQLEKRFFSRSRLLKMLSCLNRVWEPCSKASNALRSEKRALAGELESFSDYLDFINEFSKTNSVAERLNQFIRNSESMIKDRIKHDSETLTILDKNRLEASEIRELIENDMKALEQLTDSDANPFDDEIFEKLLFVFGQKGANLKQRCGWSREEGLCESLEILLDNIQDTEIHRTWKDLKKHAERRVSQMLDIMEKGEFKNEQ